MLITNSNHFQPGIRRRTLRRSIVLGPISIKIVTILLVAAFALFYLAQSTQSAARNYTIYELQGRKEKLQQEKNQLEVEAIRLKSLTKVEEAVDQLQLETQE